MDTIMQAQILYPIVAATVGVLVSCGFLSGHYNELLWALLAACLCFHAYVERQLRLSRALTAAHDVVDNVPLDESSITALDVELSKALEAIALEEFVGADIADAAPR